MNKHYNFISQQIIAKNGLNAARYIGSLIALMDSIKPMTKSEWQEGYVKYVNENQIPLDWVIDTALGLAQKERPEITREDVKECVRVLVIDKTWEGRQRELSFAKWLSKNTDKEIIHADDKMDRKYAVDFLLRENGEIVAAFQVKPLSYFNYAGADYDRNQIKYSKFKKDYGVKVIELAFEGADVVIGKNKVLEAC